MSGPVPTTRALKRNRLSSDDQSELDDLDRIFKRTKTVVPPNPYILSTPSLDPYRYHSQQEAHAWMLGHLWKHTEEHLQYRTYLYREPCQDCFELQAGDDEPDERPRSHALPEHATSQAPKKKISLEAYKNKQANGVITPTPGSKIASPSLPPTKTPHTNGVKHAEKPAPAHKPTDAKPQKPHPTDDRPKRKPDDAKSSARHPLPPRPPAPDPKRPSDDDDARPVDKSSPSNATPHGLPPMLSPVHEPLSNPYGLPNILSPTLPSSIQAELDRIGSRPRAESSASEKSGGVGERERERERGGEGDGGKAKGREREKEREKAGGTEKAKVKEMERARAPVKEQERAPAKEQERTQAVKADSRIRTISVSGKSPYVAPKTEEKKKIVVLKFSKGNAATVRQVLRLPPKRRAPPPEKKESQDPPKESPVKIRTKVVEPARNPKPAPKVAARRLDATPAPSAKPAAPAKVAEKRPRADEDASLAPAKRQRALSSQDRPDTPTTQATSSPVPSARSSAKSHSQLETPKKEHKAVNMLRTGSSESQEATPGRSGGTPAARPDARSAPTSAPVTGKKQAEISHMAQTSMKLNQMGRALKHEATKILTEKGNKLTKQDEKRAAVTNLECILSYMAAYYAQDLSLHLRNRAGEVEQTWKTLLPLCHSYARITKPFPHLDGLRSYLSSTIASTICTLVSQRLPPSPSKHHPADSPHTAAKDAASLAENFALLADHTRKATSHFQDARIALPLEDLQTQYKRTWAARETNTKLIVETTGSSARLAGPYFLPLGPDTSAIQAVRFGLRFLHEYCEREGVGYAIRVHLEGGS